MPPWLSGIALPWYRMGTDVPLTVAFFKEGENKKEEIASSILAGGFDSQDEKSKKSQRNSKDIRLDVQDKKNKSFAF